jgi:23S rRNA pseudouridine955/2504/2580 synthase
MLVEGCVRLNPQSIDGSGFFIAIFEKIKHRSFPREPNFEVQCSPPTKSSSRIAWRARNEANHYELIDETSAVLKEIVQFYGLSSTPGPLLAEFNTKGRLTQLNLINESLRSFLQGQLQCKASPLAISVGVPLFKPLPDGFMTEVQVPCRWRPALEGSGLVAPLMTKRALQLDEYVLRKLLAERILPMQELYALAASENVLGVGSCEGLLGGVVAGLPDGSFWMPCVVTGQGLELFASAEELGVPAPELLPPRKCSVLLEGHGYVVLQKPAGLRTEDALDELRRSRAPHAELVSRLDRDTSGCLLVPTTSTSAAALSAQFAGHEVQKTYLALVQGVPPAEGVIDAPLALAELGGGSRYRAYVDGEKGKPSETSFRTLWSGANIALVEAKPVTGRTHQIRCHFAHTGFPLVGDSKYGAEGPTPAWCTRLPLHCLHMLAKDELGAPIDILAPPPEDFVAMLEPAALRVLAPHRQL